MNFAEVVFGAPEPPPIKRDAPLVVEDMVTEIAYHEASHFVIGILVLKLDLNFKPYQSIEINVSVDAMTGVCKGMQPPIPQEDQHKPGLDALFFKEDKNRIFGKLFSVIVGYESYKVFIDDDKYFIGHTELLNYKNTMWYYKLEHVLKRCTSKGSFIKDYYLVNKILGFGGYDSYEEKLEIVIRIQNDLKELLNIQCVADSIRYVANALIEKNGSVIGDAELEVITEKVKRNINKIPIMSYLNQYEVFES